MSVTETNIRHNLIIEILSKQRLTFLEITEYLTNKSTIYGYELSKGLRTFQRDVERIAELHGIIIKCDKSTNRYYVSEIENASLHDRLNDSLHITNAFKIADSHKEVLFFENRKSIGTEHLHGLLHAAKNNLIISFDYTKYWELVPTKRKLQIYALKESQQRWYAIGVDDASSEIRTFGLDRISNLMISNKKFKRNKSINIEKLFEHSFGIINHEGEVQNIELIFDIDQAGYIKAFPLHHTQQLVNESENSCTFSLQLIPSYDFLLHILSFGNRVMVSKPAALKKEIIALLNKTIELYK